MANARIRPQDDEIELNPQLIDAAGHALPYLDSLLHVAQMAAQRNLLIVLAAHHLEPDNGLWYNDVVPESKLKASWSKLAAALCKQWNVVAVDLHNELHEATWGQGSIHTRWDMAAARLGDHVLSQCPRWMILVQGIATGALGDEGLEEGYWWGGEHMPLKTINAH